MALMGLLCLSGVAAVQAEAPRGVAVTPRNFPHHTAADVDQAFRLAREVGQHAVFIYQWGELNLDVVKANASGEDELTVRRQRQDVARLHCHR
jgi:hypothetical protein